MLEELYKSTSAEKIRSLVKKHLSLGKMENLQG
jgi:hypothetical protein